MASFSAGSGQTPPPSTPPPPMTSQEDNTKSSGHAASGEEGRKGRRKMKLAEDLREKLLRCHVCRQLYDSVRRRPLLLPCGHGLCSVCYNSASRRAGFRCQRCPSQGLTKSKASPDSMREKLLEMVQPASLSKTPGRDPAMDFIINLRKTFVSCQLCKLYYDSKDHRVVRLSCQHHLCLSCEKEMRVETKKKCPVCGKGSLHFLDPARDFIPAQLQEWLQPFVQDLLEKGCNDSEMLENFDLFYAEKGKVYIFPDVTETKAKVYEEEIKSQSQTDAEATTDEEMQSSSSEQSSVEGQQSDEKQANPLPKDQVPHILNTEKWNRSKNAGEEHGQMAEIGVALRIKETLEKFARPDESPVFLFHNQDLNEIQNPEEEEKSDEREKGESDVLVLHPTLGVLLVEVKANLKYKRQPLHKATNQLLYAQKFIQQEMGDLLEKDAIVLTIAQPCLEDVQKSEKQQQRSDVRKQKTSNVSKPVATSAARTAEQAAIPSSGAVARPDGKARSASSTAPPAATPATDVTSSTSRRAGKQGRAGNKSGKEDGAKKVEHLEDHPEIKRMQGCKAEVFEDWVKEVQEHRASSGHAFKGSTAKARLRNFKLACIRRCSVAGLHPGQSVKASADLHHRLLLTEEQLYVRDSQTELLHIRGPFGSGKTLLLAERGRRWLQKGRHLAVAVGYPYEVLLHHLTNSVCDEKTDMARVSTHRSYSDLLQWLDTVSTEDPVSIILDEVRFSLENSSYFYSSYLDHVKAGHVCGLWTACTTPLSDKNERKLQSLGGSTVQLSVCLRCPLHVMAWTNSMRANQDPPLLPPPVPITLELGVEVKVISHPDHLHFQSWRTCPRCRDEVRAFFARLGLHGQHATSALSLSDIVVLTTEYDCDRKELAAWLCRLGLHAVVEERETWRSGTPVLPPGVTPTSADHAEDEVVRQRILKGKDVTGSPAVQVLRINEFVGLERKVVLLWYEDMVDEDKDSKIQGWREDRMSDHRYRWILAASRCQGRLAVMMATPSPVLSATSPPKSLAATASSASTVTSASPAAPTSHHFPVFSSSLRGEWNPRPSTPPEWEIIYRRCRTAGPDTESLIFSPREWEMIYQRCLKGSDFESLILPSASVISLL